MWNLFCQGQAELARVSVIAAALICCSVATVKVTGTALHEWGRALHDCDFPTIPSRIAWRQVLYRLGQPRYWTNVGALNPDNDP